MGKKKNLSVIVLAAGKGTRMKSSYPKVLHTIFGKPMLFYILRSVYRLEPRNVFVVVGYRKELIKEYLLKEFPRAVAVDQDRQLGTAHAVSTASGCRKDMGSQVMVLSGDCPLILPATLARLADKQARTKSSATILSTVLADPTGYGRILKDGQGNVVKVVEEDDATKDQKMINQVNTSIYCFDRDSLFDGLKGIGTSNTQNEYYLTDIAGELVAAEKKVTTMKLADYVQVLGVNDRIQLSGTERIMQQRINEKLMAGGVTIRNPENTYIQDTVRIGPDTVIEPYCFISGNTRIGAECMIGPFCQIADSTIGKKTSINSSVVLGSSIGEENNIGPYSYIRPNTRTGRKVKVGGFCEVKKSAVGQGSKVPHLSYVGDTDIGERVNIGASCVTVNYDGYQKHKTVIEDDVFIGSDTMLIAPVRVGRGAIVAAGSVITDDIPPDCLAIARGMQKNLEQGAIRYRKKKEKKDNRRS
ncbi:MAG: bifunctional UDP-N-acetylglucosamine diphosphorylase/glucosamine-1-phosphate N-acetyltransferase GlmU [Actinomycetota bacterium]